MSLSGNSRPGWLPNGNITAKSNGHGVITVMLDLDLARWLGVSGVKRGRFNLRYGVNHQCGKLVLSHARVRDKGCIPAFSWANKWVGFNLNPKFVPDIAVPQEPVLLPHAVEPFAIIIDPAPLRVKNTLDLSPPVA